MTTFREGFSFKINQVTIEEGNVVFLGSDVLFSGRGLVRVMVKVCLVLNWYRRRTQGEVRR